ncbi:uncharacterized protein LOC130371952 isoform X3 [Gadus chalcogrammus]|uniref:uncharacterized protein LOC130371952 isoform X3 n=1 Tax=Gadus chalcogrammus TaxID=1042646 RepID=UPI0024C4A2FA|nr:uncharacterized protein LOC130371952 isoform X3 [Gadus chalcogrammus]
METRTSTLLNTNCSRPTTNRGGPTRLKISWSMRQTAGPGRHLLQILHCPQESTDNLKHVRLHMSEKSRMETCGRKKRSGLYSQRLQQSGSGVGSCRWMLARSRSVLQEQTVEVMEAVVWRCSSGGPWRSSGGARREVHGGRLEALAAGGGKAGSRAAQRMQNEGLRRRAWRRRPAWRQRPALRRRWPGGPGGVQPGRGGMEGQVAVPHPGLEAANLEGLETAEVLEAAVGSNLEGLEAVVGTNLEAVVGTNLEVPAVASTWRRSAWRARLRSAWRARRRSAWRARRLLIQRNEATLRRSRRLARWRSWRRRSRRWRTAGGSGGGGPKAACD